MAADDVEFGHVVDLTLGEPSGTELVANAAIGATTLTVDYAGDFEDTGEVSLNGTVLPYTAITYGAAETDPDVITLAAPLAAAAVVDDKVVRMSGGEQVTDWLLHVSLGDGDAVDIPIPFGERAFWSSMDVSTPVPVLISADLERLVEVPGRTPVLDGALIDPTSTIPGGQAFSLDAPTATDGYPEDYGWWQVDAAGKVLGFWRLVGGVWTPQTIVTAEALQAGNILADAINATDMSAVTVTGATLRTSSIDDQGIHLDSKGLRAYGPAGGSPFLDVDPAKGLVIVAGEGTFDKLTTPGELGAGETSAELGGLTQIKSGGKVTLVGGALPPAKAPTLGYTYDTTQFTNDGKWADRYGWSTDGTNWFVARRSKPGEVVPGAAGNGFYVERWAAAGTLQTTSAKVGPGDLHGSVVSGGDVYAVWRSALGDWWVSRLDATTLASTGIAKWTHNDGTRSAGLGYDATAGNLIVAQSRATDDKVRIRRYTWPALDGADLNLVGTFIDTDFAYNNDLAGVTYGTHDLGANRYVFTARSGENTFKVVDSTGAAVADEDWQAPARRVGFAYDGGAFKTVDWTGTMRTFTGLMKGTAIGTASLTKWVSSTNYRGGTPWETTQSPRASITVNKRSKLTVTTAALPATPGANDPNQVQVYVGQGASNPARTAMWRQSTPAVGAITATYPSLVTSGTNPPSTNNFPAATQAILEATTGGFTVDAASNGSVGTGTLRDSVDARANAMSAARMQAGTASSGTVVAATAKTVTVTFPTAFSSAPKVVVTGLSSDVGAERRVGVVPGSETTTQFQLSMWRATGTASFDANWIAVKP